MNKVQKPEAEKDATPMPWYQVRRVVCDNINELGITVPSEYASENLPSRVTARCIIAPLVRTFLCSSTPMLWFEILDVAAEWEGKHEDVSDSYREWWDIKLIDLSADDVFQSLYLPWRDYINADGTPIKEKFVAISEIVVCDPNESDDDGFPGLYEMLNYSIGNHLV